MEKLPYYKLGIYIIKIIPMLLGMLCLSSTILQYYNISNIFISYISYFVMYIFIFVCSFVFKFCIYHRMFIYYIIINNIMSIYDTYIGIPINTEELYRTYILITGIFLFIILYLHVKTINNKRIRAAVV